MVESDTYLLVGTATALRALWKYSFQQKKILEFTQDLWK